MEEKERSLAASVGVQFIPGMFARSGATAMSIQDRNKQVAVCTERINVYDLTNSVYSVNSLQEFLHPSFKEALSTLPEQSDAATIKFYFDFIEGRNKTIH